MKLLIILACILFGSVTHAQNTYIRRCDSLVARSTNQLKAVLNLSEAQRNEIIALRRREFKILDSIAQVEKSGTIRFERAGLLLDFNNRVRAVLTEGQRSTLDSLSTARRQSNNHQ